MRKGLDIYESLFKDIFEGDNLLWNQDLVTEYIAILMKYKDYARAIDARKQHIRFLKK